MDAKKPSPSAAQQLAVFRQECSEHQKNNSDAAFFGMTSDGRFVAYADVTDNGDEQSPLKEQQERLRSTLLNSVGNKPLSERQVAILPRINTKMPSSELTKLIGEFTGLQLEKAAEKAGVAKLPDPEKMFMGPMQPAPDFKIEAFQSGGKNRETCEERKELEHLPEAPYKPHRDSPKYTAEEVTKLEYRVVTDPERVARKLKDATLAAAMARKQQGEGQIYKFEKNPYSDREVLVATSPAFARAAVGAARNSRSGNPSQDRGLIDTFSFTAGGKSYPVAVAGVFDGHGGENTAVFLQKNFIPAVKKRLESLNQGALTQTGIWNALKLALVDLDRMEQRTDGSTACVSLVINGSVWTINVGDSRAVLPIKNIAGVQLSLDQKVKPFIDRHVIKRGGVAGVDQQGVPRAGLRTPVLMMPRAIGDHSESSVLSARGTVTCFKLSDPMRNGHLVIGSDGVFDVLSSSDIVNLTNQLSSESPSVIARHIVLNSIAWGSVDDITAVVVPVGDMMAFVEQKNT